MLRLAYVALFSQIHYCLQFILFFCIKIFLSVKPNHNTPGSTSPRCFGHYCIGSCSCFQSQHQLQHLRYFSFVILFLFFLAYNLCFVGTSFTLVFQGSVSFLTLLHIFHRVQLHWHLHHLCNTYSVHFFIRSL